MDRLKALRESSYQDVIRQMARDYPPRPTREVLATKAWYLRYAYFDDYHPSHTVPQPSRPRNRIIRAALKPAGPTPDRAVQMMTPATVEALNALDLDMPPEDDMFPYPWWIVSRGTSIGIFINWYVLQPKSLRGSSQNA